MEVSGQLHVPDALPLGKEPLVPIGQEAGWAPEPFWTRWCYMYSVLIFRRSPKFRLITDTLLLPLSFAEEYSYT
jgi:hypothetical protein